MQKDINNIKNELNKILEFLYDFDLFSPYQEKIRELDELIQKLLEKYNAE